MKKVALIFAITLLLSFNVHAETYYGIDIFSKRLEQQR